MKNRSYLVHEAVKPVDRVPLQPFVPARTELSFAIKDCSRFVTVKLIMHLCHSSFFGQVVYLINVPPLRIYHVVA